MVRLNKRFFLSLFRNYQKDEVAERSAALAYYLLISLIPLVGILVLFASALFGEQATRVTTEYAAGIFGTQIVGVITDIFGLAGDPETGFGIAALIGLFILLYGGTNVFYRLQKALFSIFHFELEEEGIIQRTIAERVLAIANMVMLFAFVLILVLVYLSLSLLFQIATFVGDPPGLVRQVFGASALFVLSSILFSVVFRYMSYKKVSWTQAGWGGGTAAFFLVVLNMLFSVLLSITSHGQIVSTAGSLVIFLLWAYYLMQTLLIGAVVAKTVRVSSREV